MPGTSDRDADQGSEKEADKKEAIYRATIQLVWDRGFHSTPMSLIASEAGVAAGTIYLYFKSKEELLNQLYLKIKKEYNDALLRNADDTLSIREALERVWANTLDFQLSRPAEFSFMEQFKNSPFIFKITIDEGMRIFQPIQGLIRRGKKTKVLKDIPEGILYALFFAPLGELVKQHRRSGTTPSKKEIQAAFQGCWDAVQL